MKEVLETLEDKGIILYPTDTVWGIGCDATSNEAVKSIYSLKKREDSKALIVLVSSLEMLKEYAIVSPQAFKIIQTAIRPTTIIYQSPKGLAKSLLNKEDNSVAIRIVQDDFCQKLINHLRKPIVSTSANLSGRPTPKSFSEIEPAILNGVDYVVNLRRKEMATKSSTIIKIEEERVIVIRE